MRMGSFLRATNSSVPSLSKKPFCSASALKFSTSNPTRSCQVVFPERRALPSFHSSESPSSSWLTRTPQPPPLTPPWSLRIQPISPRLQASMKWHYRCSPNPQGSWLHPLAQWSRTLGFQEHIKFQKTHWGTAIRLPSFFFFLQNKTLRKDLYLYSLQSPSYWKTKSGLPWWFSDWDSAPPPHGAQFDLWLGKFHAQCSVEKTKVVKRQQKTRQNEQGLLPNTGQGIILPPWKIYYIVTDIHFTSERWWATKHEAPCHAFSTWSSDLSMHKRTTRRVRTGPIGLVWGEPAVRLATRLSALLTLWSLPRPSSVEYDLFLWLKSFFGWATWHVELVPPGWNL